MKLFTREEKRNQKLMKAYEKHIEQGKRPTKAAKLAREELNIK